MTRGAFLRSWFVEKHAFASNRAKYSVTLVTRNMLVRALQSESRLRVMVEKRRGLPLHSVVAAAARRP